MPQRLLAPIDVRLERNQSIDALALALAAWMRWQSGRDDAGRSFAVDDPLAGLLAARLAGAAGAGQRIAALLSLVEIFPPALAADPRLRDNLLLWYRLLEEKGANAALHALVQRSRNRIGKGSAHDDR